MLSSRKLSQDLQQPSVWLWATQPALRPPVIPGVHATVQDRKALSIKCSFLSSGIAIVVDYKGKLVTRHSLLLEILCGLQRQLQYLFTLDDFSIQNLNNPIKV